MTNLPISNKELTQSVLTNLPTEKKRFLPVHFQYEKIGSYKDQNGYNDKKCQEVYKCLIDICALCGVSKPLKETLKLITSFLIDEWGDFSIQEISIAFKMAYTYKLDVEDLNNYGTINVIWIARILKAYRDKRESDLKSYELEKRKVIEQQSKVEPTQEDQNKIMATAVMIAFDTYKNTNEFSDIGNSIFKFLAKQGNISLTQDEQIELMAKAEQSLKQKSMSDKYKNSINRVLDSLKDEIPAFKQKMEARDIAVTMYFDRLIENKVEVKDLMRKYLK